MNEIVIVKKEVMEKEWTERIQSCRESGMTVSEWCRDNNINLKTYYYHLRKLRKKTYTTKEYFDIIRDAKADAQEIRKDAEQQAQVTIENANQEAADIVDEALKDSHDLKAEKKALTEENENLKNDIQSNRKQIMILVNVIANMPKKKFKLFRDTEKYEMDKEAYDGFMSAVDTIKRLSGNTLTSDEDKAAIEERLRQIEQLKAEKEQ